MVRQQHWSVAVTGGTNNDNRDSMSSTNTYSPKRTWFAGRYGFKDDASAAKAEHRRGELKSKILAGVQDFNVEKYRKSDHELKSIKNEHVRAYYEAQNQKLNDWAEVDSLVWSLADDVVDSTNPDADHDGIIDRSTPLNLSDNDLEAFLPPEERERRAKSNRTALLALNVRLSSLIYATRLTHVLDQCIGKCAPFDSKNNRSNIHTFSVLNCFPHRLGFGLFVYNDYLDNKSPGQSEDEVS